MKSRKETTEKPEGKRPLSAHAKELGVTFLIVLLIQVSVVRAYNVPTGSMKTTILEGDYLFANKFIYGIRTPSRIPFTEIRIPHIKMPGFQDPDAGDIVVFESPEDPSLDLIKRCIAVSGQTVEIKDGEVFVDGKPEGKRTLLGEKFDPAEGEYILTYKVSRDDGQEYEIRQYKLTNDTPENRPAVTVPDGHFFMMGDNRDNSRDSRFWGTVPLENVIGQGMLIYWSSRIEVPLYNLIGKVRWSRIGSILH